MRTTNTPLWLSHVITPFRSPNKVNNKGEGNPLALPLSLLQKLCLVSLTKTDPGLTKLRLHWKGLSSVLQVDVYVYVDAHTYIYIHVHVQCMWYLIEKCIQETMVDAVYRHIHVQVQMQLPPSWTVVVWYG